MRPVFGLAKGVSGPRGMRPGTPIFYGAEMGLVELAELAELAGLAS